ncbi:MAG: hypothetical protein K6F35_04945 [Lachnospiraceae bacterium]|nr:hypothetical protein [Lachnospiraceae bacterium]
MEIRGIAKIFRRPAKMILSLLSRTDQAQIREKQMLMHPGKGGRELLDEYYTEKISVVLLIVTAGLVMALVFWIRDLGKATFITNNALERAGYGEGERTVQVDLYADDELYERNRVIEVTERQYSEEEIAEVFSEIGERLSQTILGENQSADHVDHDLELKTSMEDYPVGVEWLVSDYTVLNGDGKIQDEFRDDNGSLVKLTAALTYGESRAEYEFYVNVFPKALTEEEEFKRLLDEKIDDYNGQTVSTNHQLLPSAVGGKNLKYRRTSPKTAFYILFMTLLGAAAIYVGKDRELDKAVKHREREMLLTYPEIVSKLTLLLGAGLTVRAAFEKTVWDRRETDSKNMPFAYEEMLITVNRMKSGMSEYDAYLDFGRRCAQKRYIKLGALLSQNIRKGNQGLLPELEAETKEAFEDRKAIAKKLGEEAGTKLLGPMAMMLSVVMIVVIVPAFLSFK